MAIGQIKRRRAQQEIELLTAAEVCSILRIGRRTLNTWITKRKIAAPARIGPGKGLRWRREQIEQFLANATTP